MLKNAHFPGPAASSLSSWRGENPIGIHRLAPASFKAPTRSEISSHSPLLIFSSIPFRSFLATHELKRTPHSRMSSDKPNKWAVEESSDSTIYVAKKGLTSSIVEGSKFCSCLRGISFCMSHLLSIGGPPFDKKKRLLRPSSVSFKEIGHFPYFPQDFKIALLLPY